MIKTFLSKSYKGLDKFVLVLFLIFTVMGANGLNNRKRLSQCKSIFKYNRGGKNEGIKLFIRNKYFNKNNDLISTHRRKCSNMHKVNIFRLKMSNNHSLKKNVDLENYRNIGIIAHIDAGKTTTTERILYYTNVIKKIGEVHEGLSTMDYLDIEREKGITINAAVTTCYWNGSEKNLGDYRINIIDTPGHVDFTAEVEKSLRVLDGGIVVFDSSEGVESQSETVWKQANRYNISRIIFLNKLDKVGANFESCIEEIKRKLNKKILILYVPVFEMSNFITTIDILKEKMIVYKNAHDFYFEDIPQEYYGIFLKYKNLLYEQIAENFNTFLDNYLNDKVMKAEEVEYYIRKLVVEQKYNVVICGSSLKNKNVQMLLDMVVKYLPSPIDCIQNYKNQIIYKYDVNKKGEQIVLGSKKNEKGICEKMDNVSIGNDIGNGANSETHKNATSGSNNTYDESINQGINHKADSNTFNSNEKNGNEENVGLNGTVKKNEKEEKDESKQSDLISEELNKENIKDYKRKFVGLIYKIMNDQHLGNINYVRIYEGKVNKGDFIYNNRTKKSEKISKIFFIHSSEKYELENAYAGDIVGIVGLKDTQIGDTISNVFLRAELKKIKEIPPIISFYIYNKNKNEYEKLINALIKIKKEDHSFFFHINPDTKDLLISGVGELHLQIIINKIQKDFNIPIIYGQPQISYKETFIEKVEARGKYIKQSGGRGQYGDVHIKIEPMYNYTEEEDKENDAINNDDKKDQKDDDMDKNCMNIDTSEVNNNIIIKNEITCGAIPSVYFDAINTGIREQCNLGVLSNSPLINIVIRIVDGSFHPVDSNEHAFKLAAGLAIREAAKKTNVRLLEPIMNINVTVPTEYLGEVISDLVKKRGKIQHIDESDEHTKEIYARAPMASILSYVSDLRKITKGRGNYTMTLHTYSLVPPYIQEQLLQKKE
ncbi:elongation factor G, putative [Plasmodium chabaudi chabaudi]|uniref:Elongation factor G, putative n=1 Tax=Plasmodium chabaudi chabaudi TaxID=31271 RepID=A0A4V6M8J2_PLACU|nr:elongation factor G, putative [Plasmodium chabaudi chabaudi]VTZ66199.1 elongation factor G, putative [Plasmodium chabaudi chabaudi]|eukprot:XP_016652966.1 elongation factor G, putative [Plasmodium chabaudi chabaudi]